METEVVQRSTEWRVARLGYVTASRFKDVLVAPRSKTARQQGELSETAFSYLCQLVAERATGQPCDRLSTPATGWGVQWEAVAFEEAAQILAQRFEDLSLPVGEFAFIEHPTEPWIGCSPDGVVGDDALLEIKCPYNPANFARMRIEQAVPEKYLPQIQGSLWITGRQRYFFACYDPRWGEEALFMLPVERDDKYIDEVLSPAVLSFRDRVLEEYQRIFGDPF